MGFFGGFGIDLYIYCMKTEKNALSSEKKEIKTFGRLGRRVEVPVNAKVSVNEPGYGIEFNVPTISVIVGVGKDHVARLVMDTDTWEALKSGEKITTTSLKEFKKNFL